MANTRKNEISTINKIRFDPTNPSEDDIDIRDIAHALSMMTRANGHFTEFYSVDSAESYIGDMTRPLKMHFPLFSEYEKKLQKVIFSKYATLDIDDVEKEKVKSVDDSLLYHEFLCYHGDKLFDFTPEIHIDVKDNSKNISETEKEFLCMYEALKIK